MGLYEKVELLCKSKGIEKSNLGDALGIKLSKGTVSKWQNGATPRASTIKAIADYFGVTVEYLTSDDQPAIAKTVQDNHGIIGHTHAPVTIVNGSERKLSNDEIELLNIYGSLGVMDRAKLLVYASELNTNKCQETVSIYRAARSDENHPDEVVEVSEERMDKLRAAKDTEEI